MNLNIFLLSNSNTMSNNILLEHSLANMIDNSRLYIVDIKLSLTNPTVAYMYLELSRANAK